MTDPRTSRLGRRTLLASGGALSLGALLAACSTGSSSSESSSAAGTSASGGSDAGSSSAASYPRTVTHAFGTTELKAQPQRVATISWVNPDNVLALGVVPVGMDAVTWGGNRNKSTDWIDAKLSELGAKLPTLYSATDGLDTDGIAATTPDVIIAAYSGLTEEQYKTLSKIAPTIAYPKGSVAWGTSWEDSLTLTAEALGKEDEAEKLIDTVEQQLEDYADKNSDLKDTTFLYGTLDPTAADQISLYTDIDNRPRFLESLDMEQAEVVEKNQKKGEFFMTWSPEKADELVADVFVAWVNDAKAEAAVKSDALLSKIPAIKNGTFVAQSDQQQALSISASSVLSLPWALTNVTDPIVKAATKAKQK